MQQSTLLAILPIETDHFDGEWEISIPYVIEDNGTESSVNHRLSNDNLHEQTEKYISVIRCNMLDTLEKYITSNEFIDDVLHDMMTKEELLK